MKRTKNINHSSFRKSWSARHLTPVALAVTAVFMLAGCEKATKRCRRTRTPMMLRRQPRKAAECTTAYTNAEKRQSALRRSMPPAKIVAAGWRRAEPADASPGGRRPENRRRRKAAQLLDAADGRLHDGPPDGRRHGATAAAVQLEKSGQPGYGQYTGRQRQELWRRPRSCRTMNVPKTAMAPKPATTTTVTRGGFGESVANSRPCGSAAGSTSSFACWAAKQHGKSQY